MPTKQKHHNLGQRISDWVKFNITEEVQKDNDYDILLSIQPHSVGKKARI